MFIFRCVSTSIFHKITTHNSRTLSFSQNSLNPTIFYGVSRFPNCPIWSPMILCSCPWSYLVPHGPSISLWTIVKLGQCSIFLHASWHLLRFFYEFALKSYFWIMEQGVVMIPPSRRRQQVRGWCLLGWNHHHRLPLTRSWLRGWRHGAPAGRRSQRWRTGRRKTSGRQHLTSENFLGA